MAQAAPAAPTQAKAPPSAKPGQKDEKAKKVPKEKVEKAKYPIPEGGLKEVPTDFDTKKHRPLKSKDFADESSWCELQAKHCEAKATEWRSKGEESKKLGSVKDRAKAKNLLRMQDRMAELMKELSADGVDVAALLAAAKAKVE